MIDYNEVITIKLSREECLQLLDLMIDILVSFGYNPILVNKLHSKIYKQVFPDERK